MRTYGIASSNAIDVLAAEEPRVLGAPAGEGAVQAVRAGAAARQHGVPPQACSPGPAPPHPLHRAGLHQDLRQQGTPSSQLLLRQIFFSFIPSGADPDAYVFGPPGSGSGSVSQSYGS